MAKSPEPADAFATVDLNPLPAARTPPLLPPSSVSAEQLPYRSWERYRITAFLGAGGMGAVYKALDPKLHRSVAIKFLRGGQVEAFDTRQRRHFEREARAQASIEHPHICKILVP